MIILFLFYVNIQTFSFKMRLDFSLYGYCNGFYNNLYVAASEKISLSTSRDELSHFFSIFQMNISPKVLN